MRKTLKYKKLRAAMLHADINQADLAVLLGRCTDYVNRCICGRKPWYLHEAYAICNALKIPISEIYDYFPLEEMPYSKSEAKVSA